MTITTEIKSNSKYDFTEGELSILISARIRLSDEERRKLKAAYYQLKNNDTPVSLPSVNNSRIKVNHATPIVSDVDLALGMHHTVVVDLLSSRDTIHIPLVLQMQSVLGVEVVSKERLQAAASKYVDYLWHKNYGESE